MDNIIAFIPAKGTSERMPNKNIRILGDKPLFCHAIKTALKCNLIDKVIIDSDSDVILSKGAQMGAIPLKRPKELANNKTTGDDLAYYQANKFPLADIIVHITPTAPFIKLCSICKGILSLKRGKFDSVVGVRLETFYKWEFDRPDYRYLDGKLPNSVDIKPTVYETMGLHVMRSEFVLKNKRRINKINCCPLYLSKIEAIDINTEEDFKFAKIVWKGLNK